MSRLHRWILVSLVESIATGEVAEGDMLPREEALAKRFGVSRGITREALRALEERGLVVVRHGRGATVSPRREWDELDPDVLASLLAGPFAREVLEEAVECCTIVETEAAALAAERATEEDRTALSAALDSLRDGSPHDPRDAELAFHHALLRASGNACLARVAEPIQRALGMVRAETATRAELDRRQEDRRAIVQAVEHRDPAGAREAMRTYLERLAEELRKSVPTRS